jgi:hypothetical protein
MASGSHDSERQLKRLAWWLDSSIPLPGGSFRIGLDALVGLIPGIGDLIGVGLSSYILAVAARLGAPRTLLVRMGINVAIEAVIGVVPVLGDVFDAFWKANQRNVGLLSEYLARPQQARRESRLVVGVVLLAVVALVLGLGVVAFLFLRWLVTAVA